MKTQFSLLAAAAGAILFAVPMCAANHTADRSAWPAETLSGTITIVDPAIHTVVIQTAGGVPFDMVVTRNTRIENGNQTLTMQDLKQDINQNVSVRFIPESRGDVARSIQMNG